jgi:hypothetical protein
VANIYSILTVLLFVLQEVSVLEVLVLVHLHQPLTSVLKHLAALHSSLVRILSVRSGVTSCSPQTIAFLFRIFYSLHTFNIFYNFLCDLDAHLLQTFPKILYVATILSNFLIKNAIACFPFLYCHIVKVKLIVHFLCLKP